METLVNESIDTAVLTEERTGSVERIECVGICHKGPIDDSPKAIRNAAEHDPEAPAAFLLVCTGCDRQLPLCAKKVDALLEASLIKSHYMKCSICPSGRVRIDSALLIPLNQ
jgi:hypothetical protein